MNSDFCLFTLLRLHPHAITSAGSVGTQEKKDKIKAAEHICYCIRTSQKLSQNRSWYCISFTKNAYGRKDTIDFTSSMNGDAEFSVMVLVAGCQASTAFLLTPDLCYLIKKKTPRELTKMDRWKESPTPKLWSGMLQFLLPVCIPVVYFLCVRVHNEFEL